MTKTILLTGATDGIGLEAAKAFAAKGHHVLLHGRNPDKLKAVINSLVQSPGQATGYVADLSLMTGVQALADEVLRNHDHIDVLINNAGVFQANDTRTDDGLELRFAVNTFAPFLLMKRLASRMNSSGRVVNLSSAAQAPINIAALTGQNSLDHMAAYAQSKLALTMWTREIAQSTPNGPAVIALNPGSLLATKMVKQGFGVAGSDISIGVDVMVRAALSDDFSGASGLYYDNDAGGFGPPHPDCLNDQKTTEVVDAMLTTLAKLNIQL